MKNIIIFIFMLIFVPTLCTTNIDFQTVKAPELFGEGTMITFESPFLNYNIGFIVNKAYGFVFKEYPNEYFYSGMMLQILGSRIVEADVPIQYLRHFNPKNRKFTGWIYFRGHERPFCGYYGTQFFPVACRWKG